MERIQEKSSKGRAIKMLSTQRDQVLTTVRDDINYVNYILLMYISYIEYSYLVELYVINYRIQLSWRKGRKINLSIYIYIYIYIYREEEFLKDRSEEIPDRTEIIKENLGCEMCAGKDNQEILMTTIRSCIKCRLSVLKGIYFIFYYYSIYSEEMQTFI